MQYRGEEFEVRLIRINYGTHPYHEPNDPLYDLIDKHGNKRFTLWWAHGLPKTGRVLNIEEFDNINSEGIMLHAELFEETEDKFQYIDNRALIILSQMPKNANLEIQSLQDYAKNQVDQAISKGFVTLKYESNPEKKRNEWINTIVQFMKLK